jgi:hypothetical protein
MMSEGCKRRDEIIVLDAKFPSAEEGHYRDSSFTAPTVLLPTLKTIRCAELDKKYSMWQKRKEMELRH